MLSLGVYHYRVESILREIADLTNEKVTLRVSYSGIVAVNSLGETIASGTTPRRFYSRLLAYYMAIAQLVELDNDDDNHLDSLFEQDDSVSALDIYEGTL